MFALGKELWMWILRDWLKSSKAGETRQTILGIVNLIKWIKYQVSCTDDWWNLWNVSRFCFNFNLWWGWDWNQNTTFIAFRNLHGIEQHKCYVAHGACSAARPLLSSVPAMRFGLSHSSRTRGASHSHSSFWHASALLEWQTSSILGKFPEDTRYVSLGNV